MDEKEVRREIIFERSGDQEKDARLLQEAFEKMAETTRHDQFAIPMKPPWVFRPDIPMESIGWRMGPSEEYRTAFSKWFVTLSSDEKKEYVEKYPEPNSWSGFYALREK